MPSKYEIPMVFTAVTAAGDPEWDVNTAADKAFIQIPLKCEILRSLVFVRGTDAGGATIDFDIRATQNSDTGRGTQDAGKIVIPASNSDGVVLYDDAGGGTVIEAGQEVVVEVSAESVTALNVIAQLVCMYVPETPANSSKLTETA